KHSVLIEAIEILSGLANHAFPLVKPASLMASEALPWIAEDARKMRVFRLRQNHLRLLAVSMGFVEWGVDIDVAAGKLAYCDRAPYRAGRHEGMVDREKIQPLKAIIEAETF